MAEEKVLDKMKGANPTRLIVYGVILALVIASLVALVMWSQKPEYRTLFAGLSDEDISAVIEKLDSRKVPYKVLGGAVKVPDNLLYETRIALAGEGLPRGGSVGFEIFDESSFGVTQFVQKINYMRAMQGELARTISQIQAVEGARVHLSVPEKGVFLDDIEKGRASIVLKLRGGGTLTPMQVQGIVYLTASAVDGLAPEDVTVVDTTGRMWTNASDESDVPMGLTAAQFEYKRGLEKDMEQRIQTMLEKTIGVGKVVARVSTDMVTTHVERTEETYDPDGQVVRSEHRTKEKMTGGAQSSGVPGVLSNVPGGSGAQSGGSAGFSQKQDEVINYEISKVISRVVEPIGKIEKMSVSVLVDGNYEEVVGELPADAPEGAEPPVTMKYVARNSDELQRLEGVIKGIVGFSEARGDTLTIESVPFKSSSMVDAGGAMVASDSIIPAFIAPYINTIIKSGVSGIIALFVILFILKPVVKRLTEETRALSTIDKIGASAAMMPAGEEGTPEYEKQKAESLSETERIKDAVRQNPRQAAMILKGWIQDNK
ncbi:Flagellar M-ring protein FliF [hydrothermal vent metagenome]|uniref:Flagellar M-ring protein FliF n=1 Tax=hydrothermal vent metagenome TaxID=652676 RepID=A0A3B0UTS9_9ZZZZ